MRVKLFITIDIDPEEYPMPADENVGEELEDGIREYIHDINGVKIKTMRVTQEIKDEQ